MNHSAIQPFTIILFFCSLYLLFRILFFDWYQDGGVAVHAAQRILQGDLPYRDIFHFWLPANFYLLASWFKIFGDSLWSLRALITLNLIPVYGLVLIIGKKLLGSWSLAAWSLLISTLAAVPPMYNHNWWGLLFLLASVWRLVRNPDARIKTNTLRFWLIQGMLAGLAVSFIQTLGAVTLIASLLTVLLLSIPWRRKVLLSTVFSLSAGVIPFIWITLLWQQNLLTEFFLQTLLYPLTNYYQGNQAFGFSPFWVLTTAFYLSFWLVNQRTRLTQQWPVRVVAVWGSTLHLFTLLSPTTGHVAIGYVLAAPLVVLVSQWLKAQWQSLTRHGRFFFKGGLIATAAVVLMIYIFIITYAIASRWQSLESGVYLIQTPQGILFQYQAWAKTYPLVEDYLDDHKPASVYMGPWLGGLHYVMDRPNSTRFDFLGPEHYIESVAQHLIDDLEHNQVEVVVWLPSFSPVGDTLELPLINDYLDENYQRELEITQNGDTIWRRKD